MSYAYGPQLSPAVGNGLGGLPRRVTPSTPAPTPTPTPVAPYFLGFQGQQQTQNPAYFSPNVSFAGTFSDGYYSDNGYYIVKNASNNLSGVAGTKNANSNGYLKTRNSNATSWALNPSQNSFQWLNVMKNDASSMCSLSVSSSGAGHWSDTGCYETVDGVDTYYFMTFYSGALTLSKVTPNYTQTSGQAASATQTFNYGSLNRTPYTFFLSGDNLYILAKSSNSPTLYLDCFLKSNLTFVSSKTWAMPVNPIDASSPGYMAENATTYAVLFAHPSNNGYYGVFIIDKATQTARYFYESFGYQSPQARLLSDANNIYWIKGGGSGGSYGFTYVQILTSTENIDFATQTYNGATFSLASSISCNVANGIVWPAYYTPSSFENPYFRMVFVPEVNRSFSFTGGNGYNFYQTYSPNGPQALGSFSPGGASVSTTTAIYGPTFYSFTSLGTNFIAP